MKGGREGGRAGGRKGGVGGERGKGRRGENGHPLSLPSFPLERNNRMVGHPAASRNLANGGKRGKGNRGRGREIPPPTSGGMWRSEGGGADMGRVEK